MLDEIEVDVSELHTIRDFVRFSMSLFQQNDIFYGHGVDNPAGEAFHLVYATLHLAADTEDWVLDARLTEQEKNELFANLQKRIEAQIPTAYIVNEAWFSNMSFYVDERVIIPRSPISELIQGGFIPWIDMEQVERILDCCTGSACIACACASYFPHTDVDAIDISEKALEVAQLNVERHDLEDNVNLIQSDVFDALDESDKYDLIISNPPYVSQDEYDTLPTEYTHEPTLALVAKEDGLAIVNRILKQAINHLTPKGVLIVEVGNSQEVLEACYPNVPFTWLQFEKGGDGVFLLTARELSDALAAGDI